MLHQAQVKDVVGATAFDNHGEKIGKVDQLLLDDRTGQPEFVAAHTGLLRRHEALIPVADATLEGGRLLVPYSRDQVRDAPESARFLVGRGRYLDGARKIRVGFDECLDCDDRGREAPLHVAGPAAVDASVPDDAGKGVERPAFAGLDHVDM